MMNVFIVIQSKVKDAVWITIASVCPSVSTSSWGTDRILTRVSSFFEILKIQEFREMWVLNRIVTTDASFFKIFKIQIFCEILTQNYHQNFTCLLDPPPLAMICWEILWTASSTKLDFTYNNNSHISHFKLLIYWYFTIFSQHQSHVT